MQHLTKKPRKEEPVKARNYSHTMDKVRHRYFHSGWSELPADSQYASKFPVVQKLTSMTGKAVASHFKNIMSEYT